MDTLYRLRCYASGDRALGSFALWTIEEIGSGLIPGLKGGNEVGSNELRTPQKTTSLLTGHRGEVA